jgi:hypothetical protein
MSIMNRILVVGIIAVCGSATAIADPARVSVNLTGAAFFDAPPGNETVLVPPEARIPTGNFVRREKVEAFAVAIFHNRLVTASSRWMYVPKIKATAVLTNNNAVDLGFADAVDFGAVSKDRRKMLISMRVDRLPDIPVKRVEFSGALKINVAKGIVHKTTRFDPGLENLHVNIGAGTVTLKTASTKSILVSGQNEVHQIAGIKIKIAGNGASIEGSQGPHIKRPGPAGYVFDGEWLFNEPVAAGEIDISVYDGFETMDLPVRLSVNKPY